MSERVTFSLAPAGDELRVSYRFANPSARPVQVHDALLQQVEARL